MANAATVQVRIMQNVTRGLNLLILLIVLSIVPLLMGIYHIGFGMRRWGECMFGGSAAGGDDD